MNEDNLEIKQQFERLVNNNCTETELTTFFQELKDTYVEETLIEQLDALWENGSLKNVAISTIKERRMERRVMENIEKSDAGFRTSVLTRFKSNRWWYAAAVIIILVALVPAIIPRISSGESARHETTAILPGKEGAILTLEDGSQVILDNLSNGLVATQSGTKVILANGQLAYNAAQETTAATSWNTINTPKGRQFKLVLPDGTGIWLNAASTVKYPTAFNDDERVIEVAGEVFLEVAKNPNKPFKVKILNHAAIEVIGTSFNIKAYADESLITTTLVEGSVNMYPLRDHDCLDCPPPVPSVENSILMNSKGNTENGQQGILPTGKGTSYKAGRITLIENVPTSKVIAWKKGYFNFEGVDFKDAMNQLMRWYNIEVIYEQAVPSIQFFGEISRNIKLTDLLKVLEDVGVAFRVESDNRLVVVAKPAQ